MLKVPYLPAPAVESEDNIIRSQKVDTLYRLLHGFNILELKTSTVQHLNQQVIIR